MGKYILKRTLNSILTVVIVFVAVFMLLRLMPLSGYFPQEMLKETDEATRMSYLRNQGLLDHPMVQLGRFVKNLFQGDLGRSLTVYPKVPIATLLKEKIPVTAAFGFSSMLLGIVFGLSLGMLMVRFKDRWGDRLGTGYILMVRAIPNLIYLFFIQVWVSLWFNLPMVFEKNQPSSWILPVICLSLGSVAWYALWLRRFMVDEENKDYVKFALVKGLPKKEVWKKHIFKNAIIPLVHGIPGTVLGALVGAIITERVYVVPGAGNLLTKAINMYDNGVIVGVTMFYAILSVVSIILGDVLMSMVDPRISFTTKAR